MKLCNNGPGQIFSVPRGNCAHVVNDQNSIPAVVPLSFYFLIWTLPDHKVTVFRLSDRKFAMSKLELTVFACGPLSPFFFLEWIRALALHNHFSRRNERRVEIELRPTIPGHFRSNDLLPNLCMKELSMSMACDLKHTNSWGCAGCGMSISFFKSC
jgi:hypothetical protein